MGYEGREIGSSGSLLAESWFEAILTQKQQENIKKNSMRWGRQREVDLVTLTEKRVGTCEELQASKDSKIGFQTVDSKDKISAYTVRR